MNVHDVIFSACAIIFIVALLPTVFGDNKPHWKTSVVTGTTLCFMAGNFYSMKLWYSGATNTVAALLWMILYVQVRKMEVVR